MTRNEHALVRGLSGYEWRVVNKGGADVPQKKVKERVIDDGDYGRTPPAEVAKRIADFAAEHDEAKVEVEHKFEDHPSYSCDYWLELTGWRTVTEADAKRARQRAMAQLRTEHARIAKPNEWAINEARRLEEQMRELEA